MGKKVLENLAAICGNLTVAAVALAFFDKTVSFFWAGLLAFFAFFACIKLSSKRDNMED
jgi:uncharacterized membrane protein (GlpM family)